MDLGFLIPVYIVRGDFGNVGNGSILGVFDSEKLAEERAKDCGSLDCGGDGGVFKGYAVKSPSGNLHVVEFASFKMNEMKESVAKKRHDTSHKQCDVVLESIGQDKLLAIKSIRSFRDDLTFQQIKSMIDCCPTCICRGISISSGKHIKEKLELTGCMVNIV